MPNWTAFAGLAGVVLSLLLALARLTQSRVSGGATRTDDSTESDSADAEPRTDGSAGTRHIDEWHWGPGGNGSESGVAGGQREDEAHPASSSVADLPPSALLANVALSQALFGAVLAVGAWWAAIPAAALGLSPVASGRLLAVGTGLGLALWVANVLAGRVGARFGVDGGEELRALLAPDSPGGWVLLLAVVLPLVALVEEFLFRATLVGALAAGFDLPVWPLVVGSSVVFALGHGAQGRAGIVVTGALGLVLGAAFAATGSLFVVVVAHYLVNALEFVVYEGLGVDIGR